MKVSEFKKVIKPLIKECIKEVMIEDDMFTNIMVGVISEMKVLQPQSKPQSRPRDNSLMLEQKQDRLEADRQRRIKLMNERANLMVGGVNVFEGVEPLTESQARGDSGMAAPGSLTGIDPSDAGVNISGLVNLAGGRWNRLQKSGRG